MTTHAQLVADIQDEVNDSSVLTDALAAKLIVRAEAKINRRARLANMEEVSETDYLTTNTDRQIDPPTNMLELLSVYYKAATAADTAYLPLEYVSPSVMHRKYGQDLGYYTSRKDIELNAAVSSDHKIRMHYIKAWSLATDNTNWLLTNAPDVYLYGALVEAELYLRNDQRIAIWKALFDDGIRELNDLAKRGRDDIILDTSHIAWMYR